MEPGAGAVSGNLHRPARRLFSGQCSPLELLFNEQHRVTDALYRDNPASACLNRYTAQIAALCSAERILEVGAGTAATTAPVLKATRQSYHFTGRLRAVPQ